MTETQERFLRTVLARVPLATVVEMHLFPPIRRGTMETGVAVIATVLPPAPLTVLEADSVDERAFKAIELAAEDPEVAAEPDAVTEVTTASVDEQPVVPAGDASSNESLETAVAELPAESGEEAMEGAPEDAEPAPPDFAVAPVPAPRLRILTAAYRHTIKGIDRGKWTVDVQEEADAPLSAVEAVLRGVRHRSTEPADPELVSHEALEALLAPTRVAPAA